MDTQNQIKRSLARPECVTFVRELLGVESNLTRTDVAVKVCEEFGFRDPRGECQLAGCLKALRELAAQGSFQLPAPRIEKGGPSPRRLPEAVAAPRNVPGKVGEIVGLELVRVEQESQMRIWNELMIREHPQGAGPLVGRQVRYLVQSTHGWLGGLGFAAPALKVADRDRWIGWSEEERKTHLHRIVCLSRFLIRPSVVCQNLASKVLSLGLGRMAEDFQQLYQYEPWLVETFVDTTQFSGTSYRAANWTLVGKTQGRGRQDQHNRQEKTVKDIYVYPLAKDFRIQMGLPVGAGRGPLGLADGLEGEEWAQQEVGGASLGDQRLTARLEQIVRSKAQKPGAAYTRVAAGDVSATKAYYNFIDNPKDEISMESILAPHRDRTMQRMQGQQTVLCIQDGSDLDYTSLPQCADLGVIGTNQTGAQSRGLHLHTTLAVTTSGLPLGILKTDCIAPQPKPKPESGEDKRFSYQVPIEEKDTFVWIKGLRDTVEVASKMPQTRLIHVCDRAADFFELFEEQRRHSAVDLLVRAEHNRIIGDKPGKLFDALRQSPVQAQIQVNIPRQSARPKRSKTKARPKRPGRKTVLEVRYLPITLPPPRYFSAREAIPIWAIHAVEVRPPEGAEKVEWFLLTSIPIVSSAQAIQCLRWYCLRWRIEDFHRVLKSGCGVEKIAHETAERIRRALAVNMIIAWRIMLMTLLGREQPESSPALLFSNLELQVLTAFAQKKISAASDTR